MPEKTIRCTFDTDGAWQKVRDRRPVFLDMNGWINMADDKDDLATRVKSALQKLVTEGLIFCPLSFGIVTELYKQAMDSRLNTGQLMEELSLNVSYAINEEVFSWEVERFAARELGVGAIDLSLIGLYVPIGGYLCSRYNIGYSEDAASEDLVQELRQFRHTLDSITLTEMLTMDKTDWKGQYVKQLAPPSLGDNVQRIREMSKGDKGKMQCIVARDALLLCVTKAISQCSQLVQQRFKEHVLAASTKATTKKSPEDNLAVYAREFVKSLPALDNHVELMASLSQNPGQRFEINDFFDYHIMPVPLAYASVFVSQDKGIRDVLRKRTAVLERTVCHYCDGLPELEEWLKAEGLT